MNGSVSRGARSCFGESKVGLDSKIDDVFTYFNIFASLHRTEKPSSNELSRIVFFEIRLRVAYFYAYIHVTFQYLATHACIYFDMHAWKKRAKDREREREKEKERER